MSPLARLAHAAHEARRRRREEHDRNEATQLERVRQPHLLTEQELGEIVNDRHAGIARELASDELGRRLRG